MFSLKNLLKVGVYKNAGLWRFVMWNVPMSAAFYWTSTSLLSGTVDDGAIKEEIWSMARIRTFTNACHVSYTLSLDNLLNICGGSVNSCIKVSPAIFPEQKDCISGVISQFGPRMTDSKDSSDCAAITRAHDTLKQTFYGGKLAFHLADDVEK